jgi:hypothetical protein
VTSETGAIKPLSDDPKPFRFLVSYVYFSGAYQSFGRAWMDCASDPPTIEVVQSFEQRMREENQCTHVAVLFLSPLAKS